MSEDWRVGYRAALRQFLAKRGRPVNMEDRWGSGLKPNIYGWFDTDKTKHFLPVDRRWRDDAPDRDPCSIILTEADEIREEHADQFMDTFEGNRSVALLMVGPISCACGKYTDLYWAYEGSLSEVILEVVKTDE